MEQIILAASYIYSHLFELIAAVNAVIVALIALFMLVPGEEPEASLKKALNFIAKFSRK